MRTLISRITGLLIAVCLLFPGLEILAEEETKKSKSNMLQFETITVTAQKAEENAREVPMGITVLDYQGIEDQGIESTVHIADFVPNLILVDNGVSAFYSPSMRGIHATVETLTVTTGLYIDGVPVLVPAGYDDSLLNIERVEVLRGPQGTLYGKNTEAGAINIITRQPDNEFRGIVSADVGEDNKKQFTFSLSSPIQKDTLYFSLAGKSYEKDGYIENTQTGEPANDKKHWYGKLQLRWTPTDRLDITLIASRTQYDDGTNNVNLTEMGAAAFELPAPEDRKISPDEPGYNKSSSDAQSMKIEYQISDTLSLTSVTANWVFKESVYGDWDFNPVKLMHFDNDREFSLTSQEFRLASSAEELKWLLGIYFDQNKNKFHTEGESMVPQMVSTTKYEYSGTANAIFGQATLPLTEKVRVTGGLRYEEQKADFENMVANTSFDGSWDEVSPKISVDYDIAPGFMTYASTTKGYRSGGFNPYAMDPEYETYDEEILMSHEVGFKSLLMDQHLSLNGTFFYLQIEDMQISQAISPSEAYVTNAAKASGTGVELELAATLTDSLGIEASYGTVDIRFDEFSDAVGDYEGNRSPYAPEYTYNVGAYYRSPGGIYVRGDLISCGRIYFDKRNEYARDAYQLVNAKVGYERENWDVYLYGKNVTDTEYNSEGFWDGFYTGYSEPREIGVKGTYRF